MTTASEFQPLDCPHQQLLQAILGIPFPDVELLRAQVQSLAFYQVTPDLFRYRSIDDTSDEVRRTFGVPVECTYDDEDGIVVYLDLYVDQNDRLTELEVWKADGSTIIRSPFHAEIRVKLIVVQE